MVTLTMNKQGSQHHNYNNDKEQYCWNHFQRDFFFQLMNDKNTDRQSESTRL